MSVSFLPYFNPINDQCVVCLDPLNNGEKVVAHVNGGEKHPIHEKCIKQWLFINRTCPHCSIHIDPNSIITFKDRLIYQTNFIKKDAVIGAKAGIILATISASVNLISFQHHDISITITGENLAGFSICVGGFSKFAHSAFLRVGTVPRWGLMGGIIAMIIAPKIFNSSRSGNEIKTGIEAVSLIVGTTIGSIVEGYISRF